MHPLSATMRVPREYSTVISLPKSATSLFTAIDGPGSAGDSWTIVDARWYNQKQHPEDVTVTGVCTCLRDRSMYGHEPSC